MTCRYSLHRLSESVSFEDQRLQKHLKFLSDLCKEHIGNSKPLKESLGISYKALNHIQYLLNEIEKTKEEITEVDLLISDLKDSKDELYNVALSEKESFQHKLNVLQDQLLPLMVPVDAGDEKDIILEISPGVGGQEAMLFAKDMFHMYCHYATYKGWRHEVLKYDTTELGGIRSAHLGINGAHAYRVLKYECGVHRVQRVPKTEKAGRIHTSTTTVAVLPQPSEIDIVIRPGDIELEFKNSSGAGGQHVNTTDSCVRIYHKATGLVVESQVSRDQHRNRQVALTSLRAKLYERELMAALKEETLSRKSQVGTAARSEKVRTYNFVQDRITDHRAHVTLHDVQRFLGGEELFDHMSHLLQHWGDTQALQDVLHKYA
ncbi:hypothetical protein JTE90_002181 [Oedothorax gibbosus]|uniref:Peptide chain release factor domain-containing protein n=1 Tax=Oedothorax gibbosus TaxID=931172 RepID=A0AAV6VFH7_9ARAC|nr:hypothetical protein JTE90_002181 [Oedothorax gibbosus]